MPERRGVERESTAIASSSISSFPVLLVAPLVVVTRIVRVRPRTLEGSETEQEKCMRVSGEVSKEIKYQLLKGPLTFFSCVPFANRPGKEGGGNHAET